MNRNFKIDYDSLPENLRNDENVKKFAEGLVNQHKDFVSNGFKNHISPEDLKTHLKKEMEQQQLKNVQIDKFWQSVKESASKLVPGSNAKILMDASRIDAKKDSLEQAEEKMKSYLSGQPSLASGITEKSIYDITKEVNNIQKDDTSKKSADNTKSESFKFTQPQSEVERK